MSTVKAIHTPTPSTTPPGNSTPFMSHNQVGKRTASQEVWSCLMAQSIWLLSKLCHRVSSFSHKNLPSILLLRAHIMETCQLAPESSLLRLSFTDCHILSVLSSSLPLDSSPGQEENSFFFSQPALSSPRGMPLIPPPTPPLFRGRRTKTQVPPSSKSSGVSLS